MDYLFDTVNYNLDNVQLHVNGSIVIYIWHLDLLITISPVWSASNGNPVVQGPNKRFLCWAMEGDGFWGNLGHPSRSIVEIHRATSAGA